VNFWIPRGLFWLSCFVPSRRGIADRQSATVISVCNYVLTFEFVTYYSSAELRQVRSPLDYSVTVPLHLCKNRDKIAKLPLSYRITVFVSYRTAQSPEPSRRVKLSPPYSNFVVPIRVLASF